MSYYSCEVVDLCRQATAIPSLDAEPALHILADALYELGYRNGLVTSAEHDPDRARRRFLASVFCRAWCILAHWDRDPNYQVLPTGGTYTLAYRISGPLAENECWVHLPEPSKMKVYDAESVTVMFSDIEVRDITELTNGHFILSTTHLTRNGEPVIPTIEVLGDIIGDAPET